MRRPAAEKKEQIARDLLGAREEILLAVENLIPAVHERRFLGEWSAHDLVAHLVGWDYTNLEAIQALLNGQLPDFYHQYDPDWRTYNALLVTRYKQGTLHATIDAARQSHAALLDLLHSLPASEIAADHGVRSPRGRRVTIAMLLTAEADDERKHAQQVKAFAETLANSRGMA